MYVVHARENSILSLVFPLEDGGGGAALEDLAQWQHLPCLGEALGLGPQHHYSKETSPQITVESQA